MWWTLLLPQSTKDKGNEGGRTLDLWHKRLGHPSEKVTRLLPNVDFKNSVLDKHCDVCLKAKQTRGKISLSDDKA